MSHDLSVDIVTCMSLDLSVDIVTCMSLDSSGTRLITGSRDLTCAIWDFGKEAKLFDQPLRTLYGHDDVVSVLGATVAFVTLYDRFQLQLYR